MSKLFGFFTGKKDEPNSASSQKNNPPIDNPAPKQENKSESPEAPNVFGGLQIKAKPTGGAKPKPFDPFNLGGPKVGQNQNYSGQNESGVFQRNEREQYENPNVRSGQGSLTQVGDETPTSLHEGMSESKRTSAFAFVQKPKIKTGDSQGGLSFVTNANPSPQILRGTQNYEGDVPEYRNNPEYSDKRPSLTSLSSEPTNTEKPKGPGSAFSFIKKKPGAPVDNTTGSTQQTFTGFGKQSSINNLDTSSQPEIDAGTSDSRSENIEKSTSSPHRSFGGPSFMKFKSPSNQNTVQQSDESAYPTVDTRSEHPDYPESQPDRDRGSETGSVKSSGPSFMKFKKQTTTTSQQSGETPKRHEGFSVQKFSASKEEDREEELRHEAREFEAKFHKTDRVVSPLHPVQTPAMQENPTTVRTRLDREEGDLLELIGDLVVRQTGLVGKRTSLENQKENMSRRLKAVANQQNAAIEGENFEEADHLEVVILELNETLRDLEKQIDDCQLEYADLEKEKQAIYQNQVLLYQTFIDDIENIVLSQKYNYEKYKQESINQQTSEKNYIEEKTKELQHNRNHIDLDLKHINEETSQITENMDKQIKDYVSEQQNLAARKVELELIVEQIRRELQAKEEELEDVSGNLNRVTNKITNIKSKFDDSLGKINKKREKVDAEESQYQEDTQKLQEHQERAELSIKRLKEVTESYNKTVREFEELKSNFRSDSGKLKQENIQREKAIKKYYDSLNELRREKRQLLASEDQIDSLKEDLNRFQTETEELNSQKNILNNKIPELEKEKKAFVASKSFKDASRTSNEIKDLQAKVTEIEEKILEMAEKEKSTAHKIQTLEKETIPSLNEKVVTISKDCDIHQYELLVLKEKDLTLIFNYYQNQRQYEEANLIENELKSAQNQLAHLCNTYPQLKEKRSAGLIAPETTHSPIEEQAIETSPKHEEREEHQHVPIVEEDVELQNGQPETTPESEEQVIVPPPENKDIPLKDLIAEYEDLKQKDDEIEAVIEQLASEEKYDEAEEATNQQQTWRSRHEEIMNQFRGLGLNDLEEAKAESLRREAEAENNVQTEELTENYAQIEAHTEIHENQPEVVEEHVEESHGYEPQVDEVVEGNVEENVEGQEGGEPHGEEQENEVIPE